VRPRPGAGVRRRSPSRQASRARGEGAVPVPLDGRRRTFILGGVPPVSEPPSPAAGDPQDDELRRRLLHAAAAVFARKGYDGTKIMDVARGAGPSTAAVYGRFRSKNDLLREAIVSRWRDVARHDTEGIERVADLIAAGISRTDRPLSDAEALRLEAYVTARREPEVARAVAESNEAFLAHMS